MLFKQCVRYQVGDHGCHLQLEVPTLAVVIRVDDTILPLQLDLHRKLTQLDQFAHTETDRHREAVVPVGLPIHRDVGRHADLPFTGQHAPDEVLDVGEVGTFAIAVSGKRPPLLRKYPPNPVFAHPEADGGRAGLPLFLAKLVFGGGRENKRRSDAPQKPAFQLGRRNQGDHGDVPESAFILEIGIDLIGVRVDPGRQNRVLEDERKYGANNQIPVFGQVKGQCGLKVQQILILGAICGKAFQQAVVVLKREAPYVRNRVVQLSRKFLRRWPIGIFLGSSFGFTGLCRCRRWSTHQNHHEPRSDDKEKQFCANFHDATPLLPL